MGLTTKQRAFIDEYLIDYNATQAAIRAGYSEKTAYSAGWRMLRNVEIRESIDMHVEAKGVNRDERLEILAEIARGAEKDSDRLTAVTLLGKLAGDYTKHIDHTTDGEKLKINVSLSNARD